MLWSLRSRAEVFRFRRYGYNPYVSEFRFSIFSPTESPVPA